MPPPLLADLNSIDLEEVVLSQKQIYEYLPHRHEFMLLSGVCHIDREKRLIIGYSDIGVDDWWTRGHVPGRVLLPGVLMLEMVGQLSAVLAKMLNVSSGFIGFGGVDECKFREVISPPCRLYLLCLGTEYRPRRVLSQCQGVCNERLVFEARLTGLVLP